MIYHPLVAYGIGLAMVAFLTVCGVKNRREGYKRERQGGILESWELWLRMQNQDRVPSQPIMEASRKTQAVASAEQLAYHGLQLGQLQVALAAHSVPVKVTEEERIKVG